MAHEKPAHRLVDQCGRAHCSILWYTRCNSAVSIRKIDTAELHDNMLQRAQKCTDIQGDHFQQLLQRVSTLHLHLFNFLYRVQNLCPRWSTRRRAGFLCTTLYKPLTVTPQPKQATNHSDSPQWLRIQRYRWTGDETRWLAVWWGNSWTEPSESHDCSCHDCCELGTSTRCHRRNKLLQTRHMLLTGSGKNEGSHERRTRHRQHHLSRMTAMPAPSRRSWNTAAA